VWGGRESEALSTPPNPDQISRGLFKRELKYKALFLKGVIKMT
jgi:hypothetical protein